MKALTNFILRFKSSDRIVSHLFFLNDSVVPLKPEGGHSVISNSAERLIEFSLVSSI